MSRTAHIALLALILAASMPRAEAARARRAKPAAAPAPTARELALEAQIRDLTARLEKLEADRAAHPPPTPVQEKLLIHQEESQDKKLIDLEKRLGKNKLEVGPANKGVIWSTADNAYKMRLGFRIQALYQGQEYDTLGPAATALSDKAGFFIRRFKTFMDGTLGRPNVQYRLQFEVARATGILDDAFIEYIWRPWLKLRAGQFKPANSRQVIESTREFILVERALASNTFAFNSPGTAFDARDIVGLTTHGVGRNTGVQLWGDVTLRKDLYGEKGRKAFIRYFESLLNGSGQNVANENDGLMSIHRLEFHPFGDFGYMEGAMDNPERPLLVLDIGQEHDPHSQRVEIDGAAGITRNDRQDRDLSNLGLGFRWKRFSFLGEYFRQWTTPRGVLTRRSGGAIVTIPIDGIGSNGWYYQFGAMLIPKTLELAWRDGAVDPNRAIPNNSLKESGACLNYYIEGHQHALQLELMHLADEATKVNEHTRSKLQYEFTF